MIYEDNGTAYVELPYEGVYEMPSTLVSMSEEALDYCMSITEIVIPTSFTKWTACVGLESLEKIKVEEGNSIYCSENNILFSKDKTKLVKIPANAIGTEYVIPETVKEIDEYAFSDCDSLTVVTISKNVSIGSKSETIGNSTFEYKGQNYFKDCVSLQGIEVVEENPNYIAKDGILFTKDGSCLVAMPRGYQTWGYTVPEDVTEIGCEAFYGIRELEYIELPEGLETIGIGAFRNSGLTSIVIPERVQTIPSSTFFYCEELSSVEILGHIRYIGDQAFYYCSFLTTIENFEYVNYIGKRAFYNCDGLIGIRVSVNVIGEDAFKWCSNLEYVYILEGTTTIEDGAFSACNNLKELWLPKSVVDINGQIVSRSSRNLMIYVPVDSVAEEYVREKRLTFSLYEGFY